MSHLLRNFLLWSHLRLDPMGYEKLEAGFQELQGAPSEFGTFCLLVLATTTAGFTHL